MSEISVWSVVPAQNGTRGSPPIYWPEGQAPSTVNDCARQMMSALRIQMQDAQWFNWGYTCTRIAGNKFDMNIGTNSATTSVVANFVANRRIKLYDSSTLYATISEASLSGSLINITVTIDAGSLTNSFSSAYLSILSPNNSAIPVGTGTVTNVTATSPLTSSGGATPDISVATMTDGQLIIGSTGNNPVIASLTAGTNVTITPGPGSITISASGFGGSIVNQNSSSATLANGNVYMTNNGASLVTYTLPATAAQGDVYYIKGGSSGGWTIAQNSGQTIYWGDVNTTTGVGGSISSSNRYDCISVRCITANTDFIVETGPQGTPNYV